MRNMIVLLLLAVINVDADVYLHNPRGSNNRLNSEKRDIDKKKENRLFDSQNNNRGGYNVGGKGRSEGEASLTYIGGSSLSLQWTNQHQCGGKNTGCDIILQYMCSDGLRDGRDNDDKPRTGSDDTRTGRHEDQAYYADCKGRQQANFYHADQNVKQKSAIGTRQNPDGDRSGLECPEERDYYPYHAPSPWKDIAILTNNEDKCQDYKAQSQNVIAKGYCKEANGLQPITEAACKNAGGNWLESPSHNLPAPECEPAPVSRDNHLGNTGSTGQDDERIPKTLSYEWSVPNIDATACALRIRYNMTVGDYEPFATDGRNDKGKKEVNIGSEYRLSSNEAESRGYIMENNPKIQPLSTAEDMDFQLAINTAQTGRTFEDRTHMFRITRKETVTDIPANTPVHNLNVIGKRGNIVEVFPAVEYGYEPAILKAKQGDFIHVQWTGSLKNNNNNDGEGRNKEDKSNIIAMTPRKYKTNLELPNTVGHPGNSYPLNINTDTFLGVGKDMAQKLAFPKEENNVDIVIGGNAAFTEIGCFRDRGNRAIKGRYERFDPEVVIQKCANKARIAGNQIFAVQYNKECWTDPIATEKNAADTYAKYGATTGCRNGRGGSWKQDVYKIVEENPAAAAAVGAAADIFVGYYENDRYTRKNGWHYVTITRDSDGNAYKWTNRAGKTWSLYPKSADTLRVGTDCPYYRRGYKEAKFTADGVYGPYKEFYTRKEPKKDAPVQADNNAEETMPITIPKDSEKVSIEGSWNFADTVEQVETDLQEGDTQIADILDVFDEEVLMENEKRGGNKGRAQLDDAPPLVNLAPVQANTCGTFNYLCTRNNNFSNRSQKGKVIVC